MKKNVVMFLQGHRSIHGKSRWKWRIGRWWTTGYKLTAKRPINHGGTTEEGNCSYLLPRAAAVGSNGTNKGHIHKVPVNEIARFLVYRMDMTRSQLSANTGIPVCLVREIWQFKVFTGKEVTPLHEEGNSLQFRAEKKATHFHYKWFIDICWTDNTARKEMSQCEIVNRKYVSRCDEQMKTTCLIRPRGEVRNTIGTEWRRLKHIYKFHIHVKWQQNAIFHGIVEARCSEIY